jgi:hypothetical protein
MLFLRLVCVPTRTFSRRLNKFTARGGKRKSDAKTASGFWLPLTLLNKPLMPLQYNVPCRTNLLRTLAVEATGFHKLSALPRRTVSNNRNVFPLKSNWKQKS